MGIIYEPKGEAGEYAPLALNHYQTCSHACSYCYIPAAPYVDREQYFQGFRMKNNWLEDLKKDAKKHRGDDREILLSFKGDAYQPADVELGHTRQVIEILIKNGLRFTILTKGGMRASRDFDVLASYPKARFGSTIVFTRQEDADKWEPGAPSIRDRIGAIYKAHHMGIPTWVSLEPVIDPKQALELIWLLSPIVRHWKVGKLNYKSLPVDWIRFRQDVVELLDSMGADYYIKESLTGLGEN